MFTENSIKALLLIAEGFKTLAESITVVDGELLPVAEETTEKVVEADAKEAPESEEEDLESLSYNELKKRAKEAGVSATGNRKELIEKIRNAGSEEAEEPKEEKKPVASKKPVKKVEEPEDNEEPEEPEDDEEEQTTQELVEEAVADMSDEELREILEDAELSTKGKRSALISRIVTAVDEGVIALGDDEAEESEGEAEESADEEAGDDITADMTAERKEAYEALCEETEESFNDGEITRDDLIDFLAEFNGITSKKAKTQYKDTEDAELLAEYLKAMSLLVSDEGEVVEEGAYTINEVPYCCGHELTYDEESETYKCEICGAEYDAE